MISTRSLWRIVKSMYLRITLNWVTSSFFIISFVHCFAHGTLQSFLYSTDDAWGALTSELVSYAQFDPTIFAQFTGRHGKYSLDLCDQVPVAGGLPHPCDHFFTAGQSEPITVPPRFMRVGPPRGKRDMSSAVGTLGQSAVTPSLWALSSSSPSRDIFIDSRPRPDGLANVVITSNDRNMSITLEPACTLSLLYPETVLSQASREELSLIASQFWFFGLAVFALIFESIPHVLALLIARMLATGWSTYTLWRTTDISDRMQHIIGNPDAPCHQDLYSRYFTRRFTLQIADLVLHWDALLASIYFSWRLYQMYRTHTFTRVGPPKDILRMYRYFLAVLVSIQLSLFILVIAMALWIDQLLHGAIKEISSHTVLYDGIFIFTTVILIPWLMMGWFSLRREWRKLTWAFLGLGFHLVFTWSVMFYSRIYRFTFIDWPFFGCMTIASFMALLCSIGFAVVCLRNYDKGLAQWLYVEEAFGGDDFEPDLFPTDLIEKEWNPEADRASIYKAALPEVLRHDHSQMA